MTFPRLDPATDASTSDAPARSLNELVGRTTEVATAVDVATGKRAELAVLIQGAPGIGKTIVLEAALDAARSAGALVLQTRPSETESRMALLGLHDLLRPVVPEALQSLSSPHRNRLEAALAMRARLDGEPSDEGQLAIALLQVLRALAVRRPLVLGVDDLQWLDPSSAAALDVALGRVREGEVRLLATARDGTAETSRLGVTRIFRDRLARLSLSGITLGELHRLLSLRLGGPVPRPTLVRIHEITQGNPYHALELARALGSAAATDDALLAALPRDVDALLRRRMEGLAPAARDVVAVVALSSRPSNETVARTLDVPITTLEDQASAAVDADLLRVTDHGLALAHPLVGGAARRILGSAGARAMHRRLSEVVTDPDEAAVHLSLGTTLADEAVASALEAAARRRLARGATIDAIEQLDRTIQLTPAGLDDTRVRRRLLLVRALILAGDTRRAGAELDALGIDAIPDPAMRAEAVLLLGVVLRYLAEHDAAIARYEDALRWVTDDRIRARLHLRLAWLSERSMSTALEHANRALALLDPQDAPLDYSFALLISARVRLHLGVAADHAAIARGEALQRAAVERDWNVSTTPIDWAMAMEDWGHARALLDAGLLEAEEAGDETLVGALLRRRVELETWSGNLGLAAELVETAVEQAESTQQLPAIASAKARRALVRAHLGDLDAADAEGGEAFAMADGFNLPIVIGYAATAVAAAALAKGDLGRVDEVATRATAELDATGDVDQAGHRFHSDHLDALIGLGDLQRASDLVGRLRRRGALGPRPTWTAIAARGAAGIALAEGRVDVAIEEVEQALRLHASREVPLESARTAIVAGVVERRLGRRKAAAARLRSALESLDRLGASSWARAAQAELSRLSGDRIERHSLTPSEERIATLASEGLRNREIAGRLGISEKTVEAALGRAYEKLGIRSRAQLATALRQRD